jgi:uncharacterized protein (DUF2235 family)
VSKNIIVLSDGTGNAASSVWRTNVWRTFQALNLEGNEQVAKYDDGVGTSSFLPLALLGGAFGWGLKRNVLDAYKFACRNYQANDKLFLFGFSRGAFTVRVLAAFILEQGLVQATSKAQLQDLSRKAYRAYRANGYRSILRFEQPLRLIRDSIVRVYDRLSGRRPYNQKLNIEVPAIEFIGAWDTVAAYGLPADEMTRGFSNWIWPLELPDRVLNSKVHFARHALALDDERTTFHPLLWTETDGVLPDSKMPLSDQRLVQVWFAGMHSNVGGGYPDDAMAFVPLHWMMNEAKRRGLNFKSAPNDDPDALKAVRSAEDKDGRLYDSRSGLGSYYRYGPRNVAELCNDKDNDVYIRIPKIHQSVFDRIDSGANAYAPIGLPASYIPVTDNGGALEVSTTTFEIPPQAVARAAVQERIWNYVWLRRVLYFFTLAATLHIAAFWLFHPLNPSHEFDNDIRLVSETVRLVGSVLPNSFHWWVDWYAANPEWFAGGVVAIVVLSVVGSGLSGRISDLMRTVWASKGAADPVPRTPAQNFISKLRANRLYQGVVWLGRRHILPFLFFLSVVWFALVFGSHLLFNVADSMGAFCHGDESAATPVNLGIDQLSAQELKTSQFCAATGMKVRNGYNYEITIEITNAWDDDGWSTNPNGYHTSQQPGSSWAKLYLAVPLRRSIFRPWFRLIARVGETGVDEYFLDPVIKKTTGQPGNTYTARFTADRNGELFLYVNDAAISLPWVYSYFYGNNHGSAKISVRLL